MPTSQLFALLFLNDLVQYTPGDTGAEDRFPPVHSADGFNDLIWLGFSFEQVPQRAFSERLEHQLLLTSLIQYDHFGVRKQFADLSHCLQIAGGSCTYVHQDDIRTSLVDQSDGLLPVFRLAHDRDAICAFEQCARPLTEQIVVVHDEYFDWIIHTLLPGEAKTTADHGEAGLTLPLSHRFTLIGKR
jgi:hypothetical protein